MEFVPISILIVMVFIAVIGCWLFALRKAMGQTATALAQNEEILNLTRRLVELQGQTNSLLGDFVKRQQGG